jgi:hypothetical protein
MCQRIAHLCYAVLCLWPPLFIVAKVMALHAFAFLYQDMTAILFMYSDATKKHYVIIKQEAERQ